MMNERTVKYFIETAEEVPDHRINFTVCPPCGKDRPETVRVRIKKRGRDQKDETITIPMDALSDFFKRHQATRPFNEDLFLKVEGVLEKLVKETEGTPTIRTDHQCYRELITIGHDEDIVAVLLHILDHRCSSYYQPRGMYIVSALHDLVSQEVTKQCGTEKFDKIRDAWLEWGAARSMAW